MNQKIFLKLSKELRNNRDDLLDKNGDRKKDRMHDFQKHNTMRSLRIAIPNGIITLKNAINDQVYVTEAIDNFEKSTRLRLPPLSPKK